MKWLTGLLVAMLVLLQYRLWFGDAGMREVLHMQQEVQAQKQENARLSERNRVLEAEVGDLKHGIAAIEERARNELGMVKKGETFYQIVDDNNN